ncbi:MAG TPA: T9SS type A sorting domain-containing protein [Bacteroidia bacterium]|nr:T9SS type A sorting domain-containing protein [Bacteroidia bacterium]
MKKIYSLILVFAFGTHFVSIAQNNNTVKQAPSKDFGPLNSKYKLNHSQSTNRAATDRWYNFGEAMDLFNQGSSVLYANNLFPDTTILVDYGTSGYSGPWIHKLADVLDVRSAFFNDQNIYPGELNPSIDFLTYYNLDSIAVGFLYSRGLSDPNIVDTLLIEVAKAGNLQTSYFGPAAATLVSNLNTDTVYFKNIPYTQATNSFGVANKYAVKIPLTAAMEFDTLDNGLNYIETVIPTSALGDIADNNLVISSLSYIPGYTWNTNIDTLDSKNAFRFISYKEIDGQFFNYTKRDWNISYIVPQDVRYDLAATWNDRFIPSVAYMGGTSATYNYEHHFIYYKVSAGLVGLNEKAESGFDFITAPNPADNSASIALNVKDNSNVGVQISDITGKVVLTRNLGQLMQGTYRETIETSDLASGLYNITLNVNGAQISKKLTVQH